MPDTPHEAPALTAHEEHPGWRAFLNKRILICVFLGFTSGLPLFTLYSLLQAWLTTAHINVKEIGLFALIGLPYTWKFVWSPLMDRYIPRFPGWSPGRRRGWMFVTQVLVMVAIGSFGFFSPERNLWAVAAVAALVAFFSASQDIVIDAYRRELLADTEQGLGNAVHVNAYKVAGLVPGSLSLILATVLPWKTVFLITAAFMLPGLITTLVVREPEIHGAPPKNLREAIVEPFHEFITRDGWRAALLVLSFIFLYKLGDTMATALATKFFIDVGFSLAQIGVILYMFQVGLELNGELLRERAHQTVAISHASIVAPFLIGAAFALYLYPRLSTSDVPFTSFALFLGVSMSITAFPVLARILTDLRISRTPAASAASDPSRRHRQGWASLPPPIALR